MVVEVVGIVAEVAAVPGIVVGVVEAGLFTKKKGLLFLVISLKISRKKIS